MKVKLAAVMALAAVILVIAAYLFGMSWGPAPQSNQGQGDGTLQENRALTEENTRLQLAIQRLESDNQGLALQLERLRTESEHQQEANQKLQNDLNRLREEGLQRESEIQRLLRENQRLQERLNSALDQLLEDERPVRDSPTGPLWFLVAVLTVLAAAFAWAWNRERPRFIPASTVRVHTPLDPGTNAVTSTDPTDTRLRKH